jgi:hypothetical protein
MNLTPFSQRLQQTLQVLLSIVIVEKTRQPVIASLHHVLRNAGEVESRRASHGPQHRPHTACALSVHSQQACHLFPHPDVGNCP